MKKFLANILIIFSVYTIGLFCRVVFLILKWLGKIKFVNKDNFFGLKDRMIIISNHPDLLDCMFEIFLIPGIFCTPFFLRPLRYSPWFTLDKQNFTDKWYWSWITPMAIPIERNGINKKVKEAKKIINALGSDNGVVLHFAEGGRTCTGKKFQFSKSGKKKIRVLSHSVGWLVLKTHASVFPIWLENGEIPDEPGKKLFSWPTFKRGDITVKFGKIIDFSDKIEAMDPQQTTELIASNLLNLADQE